MGRLALDTRFETILYKLDQDRRRRPQSQLRPFKVQPHRSGSAAARAAQAAVLEQRAAGAIAVRLEPPGTLDTPPRQVVFYRYGWLPLGVR